MLTRKTQVLLVVFFSMLGLYLLGPVMEESPVALPRIAAIKASTVERIEMQVGPNDKVALLRGEDGWSIEQPIEGEADALVIKSMLKVFRSGIDMDVLVDSKEVDQYGSKEVDEYGLSNSDRVVVSFYGPNDTRLGGFFVGWDVGGGASFVQLEEGGSVYRAKVGGRARYQKTGADWRNKMVVQLDPDDLVELHLERAGSSLQFLKMEGRWVLSEDRSFELDQKTVRAVASALSQMRAGKLLPQNFDGGFQTPSARVRMETQSGERVELLFGSRGSEKAAYVKRVGSPMVYSVSSIKRDHALAPKKLLQTLQVMQTSHTQFVDVRLDVMDGSTMVLSRTEKGLFEVTEPKNTALHQESAAFSMNALSLLRAEGIFPNDNVVTGLDKPRYTLTVRYQDGEQDVLYLGGRIAQRPTLVFLKKEGNSALYAVRADTLAKVLSAFNRRI